MAAAPAPFPPPLTLEDAQRMLQASLAYAREHDFRMGLAVVDAHGNLIAAMRMDGARFLTPETARAKAYAAAAYGRPSAQMMEAYRDNPAFWGSLGSLGRPIVPSQGALPIFRDGLQVGAMGCGGGTSQEDEDTVRAGITAAGFQPEE
jgi:glc operon protein GlcG